MPSTWREVVLSSISAGARTLPALYEFLRAHPKSGAHYQAKIRQIVQGLRREGLWPPPEGGDSTVPDEAPWSEQIEAETYTRQWHAVLDWAVDEVKGDQELFVGRVEKWKDRIQTLHGQWMHDPWNHEEVESHGIPKEEFMLSPGPGQAMGGVRRVQIRLLTWVWDEAEQWAHDPQWHSTGEGQDAREASNDHNQTIRDYRNAVGRGVESRRLIVSAMQIVWFTQAEETPWV